jgi:hypothetical protein
LFFCFSIKLAIDQLAEEPRTLKRLFDINNRIFKHIYHTTFDQLNKIHFQFDQMITSLHSLKKIVDISCEEKKQKLSQTFASFADNSLVAQCAQYIDKHNLSIQKMEPLVRTYFKVILTDVHQLIDKYMTLVKNFPVVFNGTAINQVIENLKNQLNKVNLTKNIFVEILINFEIWNKRNRCLFI